MTPKSPRQWSSRELFAAMYVPRTGAPAVPGAQEEWHRRLDLLRGRPRRGGYSGKGMRRVSRFISDTYAYFDGMEDGLRLLQVAAAQAIPLALAQVRPEIAEMQARIAEVEAASDRMLVTAALAGITGAQPMGVA